MDVAKYSEGRQHFIVLLLLIFILFMTLEWNSPSKSSLRQEIAQLKEQIAAVKREASESCQTELNYYKQKNWVMQHSSMRDRLNEINAKIQGCAGQQASSSYDCTRQQNLENSQYEQEEDRLKRQLKSLENEYNSLQADEKEVQNKQYRDAIDDLQKALEM